jgi:hypothetical protein
LRHFTLWRAGCRGRAARGVALRPIDLPARIAAPQPQPARRGVIACGDAKHDALGFRMCRSVTSDRGGVFRV